MKSAQRKYGPAGRPKTLPLTDETRRRIFAIVRERGLDDETRRVMQRNVVGKESLRDFNEAEGRQLLDHLLFSGSPAVGRSVRLKYTRPDGIVRINVTPDITKAQIRMMYALMHRMVEMEREALNRRAEAEPISGDRDKWSDDVRARLDGWARRLSSGEAQTLEELMKDEASKVIEALKDRVDSLKQRLGEWSQ